MKRIILSCLCVVMALTASAQALNKKMGNPTMEEMNMTECSYDQDADAVVLFEDFDVTLAQGAETLELQLSYKRRVKILKEDGVDAANVVVTLRDSQSGNSYRDRLVDLKAFAYNLVNGKVEKTKMASDMVTKKRMNANFSTTEFTIPQVKVGTVIEYQYKIRRDAIFDLPTWSAQSRYPVNYAHFSIALPEYFSFKINQTGAVRLEAKSQTQQNVSLGTNDTAYDFVGTNVPALPKDNEHVFCPKDFATKVTCELRSINIPGQVYKDYTSTQADVNKLLMDSENFGGRLKQKNPFKDEMAAAGIASLPTTMEKVVAAIKLMKGRLRWNKDYRLGGESQSKVMKEGSGSNADLNFVLMAMLRDAGVNTYPVVMSRRSLGRLPFQPSVDALNTFVIAFADEEGKMHYYDSSAENGYIDALPTDLNVDRAVLIRTEDIYENVTLQANIKRREQMTINCQMSEEGTVTGVITHYYRDNSALQFRNAWEEKNDSAEYVSQWAADNNLDVTSFSTQGREDFSATAVATLEFSKQLDGGDKFYMLPLLLPAYDKSSFTAETSTMPVEFSAVGVNNINLLMKLPEGYHLEETPATLAMQLPENGLSVRLAVGEKDGSISASFRYNINQLLFSADTYPLVKQFFDELAKKCNEMLVISKQQ